MLAFGHILCECLSEEVDEVIRHLSLHSWHARVSVWFKLLCSAAALSRCCVVHCARDTWGIICWSHLDTGHVYTLALSSHPHSCAVSWNEFHCCSELFAFHSSANPVLGGNEGWTEAFIWMCLVPSVKLWLQRDCHHLLISIWHE